jgi:hypothetical protein
MEDLQITVTSPRKRIIRPFLVVTLVIGVLLLLHFGGGWLIHTIKVMHGLD